MRHRGGRCCRVVVSRPAKTKSQAPRAHFLSSPRAWHAPLCPLPRDPCPTAPPRARNARAQEDRATSGVGLCRDRAAHDDDGRTTPRAPHEPRGAAHTDLHRPTSCGLPNDFPKYVTRTDASRRHGSRWRATPYSDSDGHSRRSSASAPRAPARGGRGERSGARRAVGGGGGGGGDESRVCRRRRRRWW